MKPKNVHGSFPNSSWTLLPQRLHVSLKKMRNLIQRDKHFRQFSCERQISTLPAAPYGRFELDMETRLDLSPNGPW
jgi:hypothetical protein